MADAQSRPDTGSSQSSDRGVSGLSYSWSSIRMSTPADLLFSEQETFEDATDMTPRPTSERSRSRSLISRRESSSSTAQGHRADSPVPKIPNTDGTQEEQKRDSVPEPTVATGEDASHAKSPLLTAHRISVTSDMDEVSLDEGKYMLSFGKLLFVRRTIGVHASKRRNHTTFLL